MKLCSKCTKYGKCGRFYYSNSNYAETCGKFDEIKPTHFEQIKSYNLDEMADFLKEFALSANWDKESLINWLKSEVREDYDFK